MTARRSLNLKLILSVLAAFVLSIRPVGQHMSTPSVSIDLMLAPFSVQTLYRCVSICYAASSITVRP